MGLLKTVIVAGMALVMSAAYARAADMPEFLRGSTAPSYTRWEGFYFGVQAGKTFGSADFGNADNSLVSDILANTELQGIVSNFTTLPKGSTGSASYGGFVGYNWQWADVSRFATLAGSTKTTTSPGPPPVPFTGALILPRDPQTVAQDGLVVYGFTAGLGIEAELTHNVFARAEWEFIQFPNVADFRVSTNSARVALGVKF